MRNIVVYKIVIAIGVLTRISTLAAQKPAIDLISSHQQYRHPEAVIDTGFSIHPTNHETIFIQPAPKKEQKLKDESGKKKPRQIGPSFDSIFHNKEDADSKQKKIKTKSSLHSRSISLFRLLIYITALK